MTTSEERLNKFLSSVEHPLPPEIASGILGVCDDIRGALDKSQFRYRLCLVSGRIEKRLQFRSRYVTFTTQPWAGQINPEDVVSHLGWFFSTRRSLRFMSGVSDAFQRFIQSEFSEDVSKRICAVTVPAEEMARLEEKKRTQHEQRQRQKLARFILQGEFTREQVLDALQSAEKERKLARSRRRKRNG